MARSLCSESVNGGCDVHYSQCVVESIISADLLVAGTVFSSPPFIGAASDADAIAFADASFAARAGVYRVCTPCSAGYAGSPFTVQAGGCAPVNLCATNNGGCDAPTGLIRSLNCTVNVYDSAYVSIPNSIIPAPNVTCSCPAGFAGSSVVGCNDINECGFVPSPCNSTCLNTVGSFTCAACGFDIHSVFGDSTRVSQCFTGTGYAASPCKPRTEICGTAANPCFAPQSCVFNASAAVNCSQCACPNHSIGDGYSCVDYNECTDPAYVENGVLKPNGGCDPTVSCANHPFAPRTCGACNTTTQIDSGLANGGEAGTNCTYADMCARAVSIGIAKLNSLTPCDNRTVCTPLYPGYACGSCPPGYIGSGYDGCHELNECDSSPCWNGGTCEDRINSYFCRCRPLFSGADCQFPPSSTALPYSSSAEPFSSSAPAFSSSAVASSTASSPVSSTAASAGTITASSTGSSVAPSSSAPAVGVSSTGSAGGLATATATGSSSTAATGGGGGVATASSSGRAAGNAVSSSTASAQSISSTADGGGGGGAGSSTGTNSSPTYEIAFCCVLLCRCV